MVEELVRMELRSGPYKHERRHWSMSEALLLKVKIHTTSRTLNSILESWWSVADKLKFDHDQDVIPRRLSVPQLLHLMSFEKNISTV